MRFSWQLLEKALQASKQTPEVLSSLQHALTSSSVLSNTRSAFSPATATIVSRFLPSSPPVTSSFSTAANAVATQQPATPSKYAEILDRLTRKEKPPPREVPQLEPRPYTSRSRRCGIIAIKAGMTQEWDEWGVRVPLTVLWVDECQVTQVKREEADGVTSLQLGCGIRRAKSVNKRQIRAFEKVGLPIKRKLVEFPVTPDALMPVGTDVTAAHFLAGQYVDVTGTTKGKGFQGVMKRWGFKGLPATHGVSKAHRAPGATGGRNDPGRVWKGKKLPGRHGNFRRTLHSCFVYKVDAARNLIYIRGQVPGQVGNFIMLRDAMRKKWEGKQQLPFPTFLGDTPPPVSSATTALDPYRVYQQDIGYFSETWKGKD